MLNNNKRYGFLVVAILAILVSTFRLSFESGEHIAVTVHPTHSTKHAFSAIQCVSSLIIEADAESNAGEETDEYSAFILPAIPVDFACFQRALAQTCTEVRTGVTTRYTPPIYLLNSNFRI